MFVPCVPHTTVVNKTIVYSDGILPLKNVDKNLKITCISNVNEFSLINCIEKIFESNPDVVFNTIQYSKSDKKVYFYTNIEISKKAWEDSKVSIYKPLTSKSEILEEIEKILLTEKNKDENCISLYDISNLIKNTACNYDKIIDRYEKRCEFMLKSKISGLAMLKIDYFNYHKKELRIRVNFSDDYDKITFCKSNGDLYISKSESHFDKAVFAVLSAELSKLFDELMSFSSYNEETKYGLKAVNSNFLVNIYFFGVDIFVKSPTNSFMMDFMLSSYKYSNNYRYDCNSSIVISAIKGKENEIFKRIFVKISDCPKWSQPSLYEIRQSQLIEEQKKQKKLKLKRKLFPFLKK